MGCRAIPFDARFIPGGSSSGSAVAVAVGLVSFALGTDTAGSGRIPAAFNNVVGLKPTRGLLSTRGIVPACRSLDCVSVFALTAQDAAAVFDVAAFFDPNDPLARAPDVAVAPRLWIALSLWCPKTVRPRILRRHGGGTLFLAAIGMLEKAGGTKAEINFAAFRDAGRLLYEGPWVAERLHATQTLLSENPEAMLPVTREIIEGGRNYSALDAYRAQYELAALRRAADSEFREIDVLLLPTAGTIYETAAVAAEPKRLNANLGLYTNFREPARSRSNRPSRWVYAKRLPFGISLVAPAHRDAALLDLGMRFQQIAGLPMGSPI